MSRNARQNGSNGFETTRIKYSKVKRKKNANKNWRVILKNKNALLSINSLITINLRLYVDKYI